MRAIPSHTTIHHTALLAKEKPENSNEPYAKKLFVGCDKAQKLLSVWVSLESRSSKGNRPLIFTENPEEAADRYNGYLTEMETAGFDVSNELRVTAEMLKQHLR